MKSGVISISIPTSKILNLIVLMDQGSGLLLGFTCVALLCFCNSIQQLNPPQVVLLRSLLNPPLREGDGRL